MKKKISTELKRDCIHIKVCILKNKKSCKEKCKHYFKEEEYCLCGKPVTNIEFFCDKCYANVI